VNRSGDAHAPSLQMFRDGLITASPEEKMDDVAAITTTQTALQFANVMMLDLFNQFKTF
jgi:hypothetical protein